MEARHSSVDEDVRQEDVVQLVEEVETGSEASIVLALIEPNVVSTGSELASSSPAMPSANAAGGP